MDVPLDFLLECIGFPPDAGLTALVQTIRTKGEPIPYRGPRGEHLRYPLAGGLEVRAERVEGQGEWNVWPFFRVDHRLRMAIFEMRDVPDSPFDRLLIGVGNPALPVAAGTDAGACAPSLATELAEEEFLMTAYVTDARRLPASLPVGHVLAVSLAGFALDVSYVGPSDGGQANTSIAGARGALLRPLGERGDPGGCMEVSLCVRSLRHIKNPLTGIEVAVLEADTPGRPLPLFVSRWQLEEEGLAFPRPGWRIEGAFLFQGTIAGGLPRPGARRDAFG
jgi:hypothetical protein